MGMPWLPAELAGGPFSVARARESGMPPWRLRDPGLHIPTRGVRADADPHTTVERARAFLKAMPADAVFSHVTAGQLWGLALPERLEAQADLDVMRASDKAQIRRSGCLGHRGLERRETHRAHGLPVTGLADTWVDLGEVLGRGVGLDDLIIAGDEVATRLEGRSEPGEQACRDNAAVARSVMAASLDGRMRPRGRVLLIEALGLVRAPVRSPMETRARLMFVRAGFPEPQVNRAIFDRDGGWLLEGDLVWDAQRVIGEYQGRDHASIRRRSHDASRSALAYDEGWRVLEIYAEDVYRPVRRASCLRRFASALDLDPRSLDLH